MRILSLSHPLALSFIFFFCKQKTYTINIYEYDNEDKRWEGDFGIGVK